MSEHDHTEEHDTAEEHHSPGLGYSDKFPVPADQAPAADEDVTEDSEPATADEHSGEGDEDVDEDEAAPAADSSPTSAPAPARQPWTLGQGE